MRAHSYFAAAEINLFNLRDVPLGLNHASFMSAARVSSNGPDLQTHSDSALGMESGTSIASPSSGLSGRRPRVRAFPAPAVSEWGGSHRKHRFKDEKMMQGDRKRGG